MANPEHLEIFNQGIKVWNEWKRTNPNPDLSGVPLLMLVFDGLDFSGTNLRDADLSYSEFVNSNFAFADLRGAILTETIFRVASFAGAKLNGAMLTRTMLILANLTDAKLNEADFNNAILHEVVFGDNDLREVKGLDNVRHLASSTIGIDTIYRSQGQIPESFLRGCGIPDEFIAHIPSLVAALQPLQFYSCFISYSHKDEEFAHRLYSRMRDAKLRVWYAPEEMKGGQKLHEQIFNAIHVHDKLLLVLSEHSLKSEWVMTEIRRARKAEKEENRRKLFPIKLVDFDAIQQWECFDADSGKDLAVEMREYFIPDFSNWKDHDSFEKSFDRLLRDLKAEEDKTSRSNATSSELSDRAVLSPRNTFKEEWEQVTSSIVEIAKRNGLINEEGVDASQVVNKLFETGIVSAAIKEKFYSLKKWHFNVVVFAGSSSEEPQSAINFVKMARELQKAIETACANNRNTVEG